MERYSRMLLHFLYCMAGRLSDVEVFVFATRLTRVTQELAPRLGRAKDTDVVSRLSQRTSLTSRGVHGSARCYMRSTPAGPAACSGAGLSCWSSPTAGTAENRTNWGAKWRGCTARHIG